MRKFFKFVLKAVGAFIALIVVLLIAAAIIIPIKFPPAKLKAMATDKLSETLKRKVTIGDVQFNVLSGFSIKGLKISNRPGWAQQNFVEAKDISISYNLFPLIWGQISLGEVRLNAPQILIERRGLDKFNFSDMADGAASAFLVPETPSAFSLVSPAEASVPTNASNPDKTALLFSVGSIHIIHGKLAYLDEMTATTQRYDMNDFNLLVKNISLVGGKATFTLATPLSFSKLNYEFSMSGACRYFLSSQSVKDMSLKGKLNDLDFELSGQALDMVNDFSPTMDGSASLEALKFSGLLPRSLSAMPEGLSLSGPGRVSFHLSGSVKKGLELSGTVDGSNLAVQYKDLFVKTTKTHCKVDFKSVLAKDGSFDLPYYKLNYQDWEVTGAFHHKNGVPWVCEAHSKSLPFAGLPGMVPRLKKTTFEGGGSLDATVTQAFKGAVPYKVNGKVVLKGVGITLPNEPYLQGMNGTIVCEGNVVRIPSMTFQSFDGEGAAGVTANLNTSVYNYGFTLKNVNAQKAVNSSIDAYVTKEPQSYKDKLYGTMNMIYKGTGHGFGTVEMESSAAGSGTYNLVKAKVKGYEAIRSLNSLFGDKSDEIVFEKIDGTIGIKNQVASYTANTEDKVGKIKISGGINFKGVYTPDMKIFGDIKKQFVTDQFKSQIPKGVDLDCLADANGNVPADFRFTGPAKENNWTWNRDRLQKHIQDCLGRALEKVLKEKGKDLGGQLKGLFGK